MHTRVCLFFDVDRNVKWNNADKYNKQSLYKRKAVQHLCQYLDHGNQAIINDIVWLALVLQQLLYIIPSLIRQTGPATFYWLSIATN